MLKDHSLFNSVTFIFSNIFLPLLHKLFFCSWYMALYIFSNYVIALLMSVLKKKVSGDINNFDETFQIIWFTIIVKMEH